MHQGLSRVCSAPEDPPHYLLVHTSERGDTLRTTHHLFLTIKSLICTKRSTEPRDRISDTSYDIIMTSLIVAKATFTKAKDYNN